MTVKMQSRLSLFWSGRTVSVSPFDLAVIIITVCAGLIFLRDAPGWAPHAYVGNEQFGDAEFWWRGALQFSQGLFWDNINFYYRMGYAVFAGLLVAAVGTDYVVFHKLLLLLFLSVAVGGYLVLGRRVGRLAALAMTASLIFSPYQAEWLAISTSDALGLIWNLIALFAFCRAFDEPVRLKWLAMGALFLALAALTRPLMTIFIAPVALLLLLYGRSTVRIGLVRLSILVLAFLVPIVSWMLLYHAKTGEFALAGHDASAFFAASSPKYQQWTPAMYAAVDAAGQKRLGISRPLTPAELNQEFWRETLANYRDEFAHHLRRLPGHLLAVAKFSYQTFNRTDRTEFIARILILGLLTSAVGLTCLMRRRPVEVTLAAAIFCLAMWPVTAGYVVIASAGIALLPLVRLGISPVYRLISLYWWTGVVAFYLVGGTWGPPLGPTQEINALGYRLGTQFLFSNDWLVILAIATVLPSSKLEYTWIGPRLQWWLGSHWNASRTLSAAASSSVVVLAALLVTGMIGIGLHQWQFARAERKPMPSPAPVLAKLCAGDGSSTGSRDRVVAEPAGVLREMWGDPSTRREGVHSFTGAVGPLIWQMPAQRRTRAMFYQQDLQFPFANNPIRTDLEFPKLLPETAWRNRQGLFFVRSHREEGPHSGWPYYETMPNVQLFVPLSEDGNAFDYARAVKFPLVRYASALASKAQLKPVGGRIEWLTHPVDTKRRWFVLLPSDGADQPRRAGVEIDLSNAVGSRNLTLSFRVEPIPGSTPVTGPVTLLVESIDSAGRTRRRLIDRPSRARGSPTEVQSDDVRVDLPSDAARVRVSFAGLTNKELVRMIELQLVTDDESPSLVDQTCGAR
jgi:hypothetical protein